MTIEEKRELYAKKMYYLGLALLKYFNGYEITSEEAEIIAKCKPEQIMPAIATVQLKANNHFAESTSKIKFGNYPEKHKKLK